MVSNGSPVTAVVRLPISWVNSTAWAFHAPEVSITNGTKMWVDVRLAYLADLAVAAWLAAAPAMIEVLLMWESASVSGTVTSHANGLPLAQGIWVAPSGRLPSDRKSLIGSLVAGTCALSMDLQRISLRWECRCCLAVAFLQYYYYYYYYYGHHCDRC